MNTLLALAILLSISGSSVSRPLREPLEAPVPSVAHKGGKWYFAQNGHAVYCFGPVMTIPQERGSLKKVATYCQGERSMVPLKD